MTDSSCQPVAALTKDDFALSDNNKPRGIDIFSIGSEQTTPVPLPPNVFSNRNPRPPDVQRHSAVLILDQVNAYVEDAAYAREQIMSHMKKVPADERIALYVSARREGLLLLQDYTTDRELMTQNLRK